MTNTLRVLIPLVCVLFTLLAYNFINAQVPTQNPPNGNTSAPINAGATTQAKSGWLGLDRLQLFTTSPTIHFYDEDSGQAKYFLYNNSNLFYLLADRNGDGSTWDASPHPFQILASTTSSGDYAMFANNVRANNFCDRSGGNCFAPSDVQTVDTTSFINTSGTGQTKAGNFTSNAVITGAHLFTAGNVRAANLCDAAGANCTAPAAILDTSATAQTKAGTLTAANLFTGGRVRTTYLCDEAGANCTDPVAILDTTATAQTKTGNLTIGGTVTATTFLYSSDARLKHDVTDITGLDIVKQLRGVSFTWDESGKTDYGFIAQEVEEVVPELVEKDENGYRAVEYANLLPFLVEAIKEQQEQIDKLEARLDRYEN